jgi:hypothetical protein
MGEFESDATFMMSDNRQRFELSMFLTRCVDLIEEVLDFSNDSLEDSMETLANAVDDFVIDDLRQSPNYMDEIPYVPIIPPRDDRNRC